MKMQWELKIRTVQSNSQKTTDEWIAGYALYHIHKDIEIDEEFGRHRMTSLWGRRDCIAYTRQDKRNNGNRSLKCNELRLSQQRSTPLSTKAWFISDHKFKPGKIYSLLFLHTYLLIYRMLCSARRNAHNTVCLCSMIYSYANCCRSKNAETKCLYSWAQVLILLHNAHRKRRQRRQQQARTEMKYARAS
jgi:hypothetical protein